MVSVGQLKSMEGYRLYTAMYEFSARSNDELSLHPGDLVWVCTVMTVHFATCATLIDLSSVL